jgi:hypothetical protein
LLFDSHNPGFYDKGKYDPDPDTVEDILQLFEHDPELKDSAILNYQLSLATSKKHLNFPIESNDDILESYHIGMQFQQTFEKQFGSDAMPNCKRDVLKSFLDNPEDIDLFRAYIGITSMIGRCNFVSSNKPRILSRMLGLKSKAAFQYYSISDENLLPTIEMYRKKYHMNRILLTLAERKYIMY